MQYMTHRNRQGRLERAGQVWNAQQAAGIVVLLSSMQARAEAAQQAAAREQEAVLAQLELHHGITRDEVGCLCIWDCRVVKAGVGEGWLGADQAWPTSAHVPASPIYPPAHPCTAGAG